MKNRTDARGTGRPPSRRLLLVALLALALLPAGVARAQRGREPRRLFLVEGERGGYAYIDRTGRVVLPLAGGLDFTDYVRGGALLWPRRTYDGDEVAAGERDDSRSFRTRVSPGEFSDGLARFSFDTRPGARSLNVAYGFMDETGKVVIPPIFRRVTDFHEGRAMFDGKDGKHGYIDREGKVVIPPTYALTWGFSEGLAPACLKNDIKDNQCGYLDREGRVVHAFDLSGALVFSEGLALLGIDEQYGFIDRAGKVVIPLRYAYGSSFSEGLAAVTVSRDWQVAGWGYIDREGRKRVEFNLDYAAPFNGGLASIDRVVDRQHIPDAYIDPQGRFVWEKPRRY